MSLRGRSEFVCGAERQLGLHSAFSRDDESMFKKSHFYARELRSRGIEAMHFPYTYISCPCTDISIPITDSIRHRDDEDEDDVEQTFDPSMPRANFSLFPVEQLLYCQDCQQIRCPRCTIEEILCWYCPSCIFEVPSSLVKSEGGR